MDLNAFLAGPIVRRVEDGAAYIWIATSVDTSVVAEIFRASSIGRANPERLGGGPAESLQLGERLFVHLVRATPAEGAWPRGELLAYDLRLLLESDDRPPMSLGDLGLLDAPNSIAYPGLSLPTFFLPEEGRPLKVVHGSCRLLHGRGEDALGAADEILTRNAVNLEERPSALFLTGDQIYADDVAQPLINHVRRLADTLMGEADDRSVPGLDRVSDLDVGRRSDFVKEQACFTSDHCDDHLLSFGEFAAMYCCAWTHENWPPELPRSIAGEDENMVALPKDPGRRRSFLGQRRALERARAALPAVRRVLANTPTYMVFDDHDVTDDWNLTEEWKDRVYGCAAGKRIIANGLASFFAFQGWGNQPEEFDASFKNAIRNYTNGADDLESAGRTYDSVLWSWNDWSFRAPTEPPIFCLDTRTQRSFDSPKGAARLIGPEGLKRVVALARKAGHEKGDPLALVSPVPVFGFELQERRQKYLVDKVGPYEIDFEAWHSNLRGLVDFMQMIVEELQPSHVVLLSGDVHYGVNARASFVVGEKEMPFAQLVSSGQKHAGVIAKSGINALGRLLKGRHERMGWNEPPEVTRFEFLKDKILERPANTDEWSGVSPVFIAPRDVKLLGIDQQPDYKECRVYVRPQESMSSYLVGDNNIGLVTINGSKVSHHIYGKKPDETIVKTAEIDTGSGSLFG